MIQKCLGVNEKNHLTIGGLDCIDLAKEFGTPAYILDDKTIRENCRAYKAAMLKHFGENATPLYASKALSFVGIYKIMQEEKMGIDVVSYGEIYTAKRAGFALDKAFFHGNNKTDFDIKNAIADGIGCFVADNFEEIDAIDAFAGEQGKKQRIILRVSPGIDPHTLKAISTGKVDSKFGIAIQTGQAKEAVKYILTKSNIEFLGFHCHIGSQIFDVEPFCDAVKVMVSFINEIKTDFSFETKVLNLGGGLGVRYIEEHATMDFDKAIGDIARNLKETCAKYNVKMPYVLLEPGRSIVANAGITLYEVGSVKQITGFKNYVSIDGGMPDNPRYALYQSPYDATIANCVNDERNFECTIAGRCCESGDLIQENIKIQNTKRGDILAVFVTGAYNYSMASNYNRIPRPPVVIVKDGKANVAVRRETFEDLTLCDVK